MALTQYKNKVYGYSHTTFMVNDTLFYIVKRVKGTIDGTICEVKDDELISCNFMTKLDKGVKQIYTFRLNTNDSIWRLDGNWKTNQTKKYYSISGSVKTATEKDLSKSKLFPHLQELNLNDAIAAIQPKKEPTPAKQSKPSQTDIAKTNTESNKPKEQPKQEPVVTTPKEVAKTNTEPEKKKEEVAVKKETTPKPDVAKTNTDNATNKPKEQPKQEPVVTAQKEIAKTNTEPEKKKEEVVVKKDTPVTSDIAVAKPKEKNELPAKPVAAVNVEKRKSEMIQSIEFVSDSITLALYDNGEIDGDTVSVLINGEVVMPKQGLKASAIKKTIYITPAMQDSFTLVLYAENLGLYPPNTGLIIVRDGDESHQIRFSADLQKNVAVLFKRKKK